MTDIAGKRLSRRRFLQVGAGAAVAASGATWATRSAKAFTPVPDPKSGGKALHMLATDGWVGFPTPANLTTYFPDPYAPDHGYPEATTYMFGFRDVTDLCNPSDPSIVTQAMLDQKGKAQAAAPLLWVTEGDLTTIYLTNLGLSIRPDLTDSHTIHWHGFRNASPLFDGVPEMSIAVPSGRTFPYLYHAHEPGTYIYHCHFEDVEHVQMGMTGIVFIRPLANPKWTYGGPYGVSTAFDREFAIILTEWWAQGHWGDAHIQESDWTSFKPDICMMNGRTYPDTLDANSTYNSAGDPSGVLNPRLPYQPISSVIRGATGDTVLLRLGHLGYVQHSIELPGIPMKVIGRDSVLLRGRDGTDLSHITNHVEIGPGETVDALINLPATGGATGADSYGPYRAFPLYDRDYANAYKIAGSPDHAGMRTEIRVYSSLPAQGEPNTP